ncbi:MAG: glycoside hydrolase family 2, partial [Deltaproteobacteria bacterium]|nr:glycoside hydrolase family 2 [Deltaproteobacteria bacterium]
APVGVLDPFWQPKGYITATEYSRFCGPVVPLARMKKLVFTNDETFMADIDACNYSGGENRMTANWIIRNSAGEVLASDQLLTKAVPNGSVTNLGKVQFPLKKIASAEMLNLEVTFGDSGIANDWDFWVFPKSLETEISKHVFLTQSPKEALEKLQSGSNVLLMPKPDTIKSNTRGSFKPIFWNRVTFPSQADHTLGILCDPQHAALKQFPTESHTNWQWYDLLQNCKPMVLDDLPQQITPIVRMIDDWFVCRKLGLVFEASVKQGKLIVCSIDLMKDLETRPVARQFRYSLLKYMQSNAFAPKAELDAELLKKLLPVKLPTNPKK